MLIPSMDFVHNQEWKKYATHRKRVFTQGDSISVILLIRMNGRRDLFNPSGCKYVDEFAIPNETFLLCGFLLQNFYICQPVNQQSLRSVSQSGKFSQPTHRATVNPSTHLISLSFCLPTFHSRSH